MDKRMKILIAYDGSDCSDAALSELSRAGLPEVAEATVVSVAELWLPPPSSYEALERVWAESPFDEEQKALAAAERARERIQLRFPAWEVRAEAYRGSPAWEVIRKAEHWQPDLVVAGSHGHTALGRFVLGSVSQKIVAEARCSVRVARARNTEADFPPRNLIGIDGSDSAKAAVRAVASRHWPPHAEVRLVTSVGPFDEAQAQSTKEESLRARERQQGMSAELRAAGLAVSTKVEVADPKRLLLDEAERWGADCIFVGTRGHNRLGRLLLGSVATAVVTRAHCSVEVVRAGSAG